MDTKMELRFRQIHLDFHTSQHIAHVGEEFDADEFADTLAGAHVNSVTCFARCHHGYIYFDTRKHPERKHPHLKRNLLAEQIEACHARGIRAPIYTTIQFDHFTADRHPEWLALQADGKIMGTPPYEPGFYRYLCVNSPYMDFLKEHIQEILETFPVDGFFLDIVQPLDDSSIWTKSAMQAEDLEPSDETARKAFGLRVLDHFKEEMTAFIRQSNQDCTIFYNAGHIGPQDRNSAPQYTHFELESLPGGGWGYQDFPAVARYARTLGLDSLGMTGKFHTSWGDFHSYKNPAALQFECYRMLALNAKCSIGDQLHPSGKMSAATYDLIAPVYDQVEKKEPWCAGAEPAVEIGLFTIEEYNYLHQPEETLGAAQMLQEGAYQFDIIDSSSDISNYSLL
ncbi:MAG: alpha-L-fucosidase, partial [Omnitrophica WOR_2 bacterium]